jgi:serine/threonine-protein kinase RsbW
MEVALPDESMAPSADARGRAASAVRDVVIIKLPAVGAYLSVLRTATAGLAARLDFTLDEIEDLRIAVDEACAMLLASALPGASLDCEFEVLADALRVSVTVETEDGQEPSRDTFAWTVLSALAGEVDSSVDLENQVTISLLKHRAAGAPAGGLA